MKAINNNLPKGVDRKLTGKELVEMGYRIDSDGFLIGNSFEYYITFGLPWKISRVKHLINP